jgi:hypothetical protein
MGNGPQPLFHRTIRRSRLLERKDEVDGGTRGVDDARRGMADDGGIIGRRRGRRRRVVADGSGIIGEGRDVFHAIGTAASVVAAMAGGAGIGTG